MPYKFLQRRGIAEVLRLRSSRIEYMLAMARDGIDIQSIRVGKRQMFIANHPDLVRDVLVTHDWNFIKGRGLRTSKPVLGQGLLTSEGEVHRRQRRLVQPAFHSQRLASYASSMVMCADDAQRRWAEGHELAMDKEMAALTLRIVGMTLFGADLEHEATGIGAALTEALNAFARLNSPLAMLLSPVRKRATARAKKAQEIMRDVMTPVIHDHREHPERYNDMLSMLMESNEGTGYMSDDLLLDESLTLFLAGHETTATVLMWGFYLLSQHPEVVAQLTAEVDTVLGGRLPEMGDFPKLTYTTRVFKEVLRLYPPVWMIVREAVTEYKMGDVAVPAGAQVAVCPYATHHDPRFWDEPESFRPARWETIGSERNGFSFFPFAAGTRNCIGENFAMMEGVLVLATFAQNLGFELLPNQSAEMAPQITLRAKNSLRFRVRRRTVSATAAL